MNRVLIIVDMQNDFITGSLSNPEAIRAEDYIVSDLDLSAFSTIFLTRDTHFGDYLDTLEGKKLPIAHCTYGSEGWQVSTRIMKKVEASNVPYHFLDKHAFGYDWANMPFSLAAFDEIVLVGVCTDICVISNALILKSLYYNTPVQVIAYMCAGTTEEKHDQAIEVMRSCLIDIL